MSSSCTAATRQSLSPPCFFRLSPFLPPRLNRLFLLPKNRFPLFLFRLLESKIKFLHTSIVCPLMPQKRHSGTSPDEEDAEDDDGFQGFFLPNAEDDGGDKMAETGFGGVGSVLA